MAAALTAGEGLAIRLAAAAIIGTGIAGSIEWDERWIGQNRLIMLGLPSRQV